MIEFNELEELSSAQSSFINEFVAGDILRRSGKIYEVAGETLYGILGLIIPSMLSKTAVLWFIPYPNLTPSIKEIREARRSINLTKQFGYNIVADAHVDDKRAQHFATFFGLKYSETVNDYNIYKGVV